MYSLDIDFLKDRKPETSPVRPKKQASVNEKMLLYAGIAFGLLLPLGMGGFWFLQQGQTSELTAKLESLKAENAKSELEKQKIAAVNKETGAIEAETKALATVFDQIKPWSAMLQDIRDRLPAGVQLTCIAQAAPTTTNITNCQSVQPPSGPPPAPNSGVAIDPTQPTTDYILISGNTYSFSSINDFVLTLQQSPFFKNSEARIVTAQLKDYPGQWQRGQENNAGEAPKLKKVVEFTIATNLSEVPASKMLRDLERKGALGLVTRIENLQEQGVLQR